MTRSSIRTRAYASQASPPARAQDAAGRLRFCVYTFGPAIALFLLPLIFYGTPLVVLTEDNRPQGVPTVYVIQAVAVCAVWFGIAAGLIMWPAGTGIARPRPWTRGALGGAFLGFSTVGIALALAHAVFVLPSWLEEFVHQLALAPTLGVVLGAYVLREMRQANAPAWRRGVVYALLLGDSIVAILVPIVLSKIGPAVFSAVAILYGLAAAGVSWRRQAFAALLLIPLVVAALPVKSYLRQGLYGNVPFQRIPIAGLPRGSAAPPASAGTTRVPGGIAQVLRVAQADLSGGFDPQTYRFRFLPFTGPFRFIGYGAGRALNRINRLSDLAYVIELTPTRVPYAWGVTYHPMVAKLVPRLFWSGKPPEDAALVFANRYVSTWSTDNLPIVTEAWMNAGWLGVVLTALFVGGLLRLIWRVWIGGSGAPGNVLIAMAVLASAVDGESNLSLVAGGVVHGLVIYWLVEVAIRSWGSHRASRLHPAPLSSRV